MNIHTDAWGKLMEHIEHTGCIDQPYQFVGQLGYYTHWQDENLTLLQLRVRFYDPEVGRFGQRDAIRSLPGLYAYALPNHVRFIDPTGFVAENAGSIGIQGWIENIWWWVCKRIFGEEACKLAKKSIAYAKDCKAAFDCTKCAAEVLRAAKACMNPDEDELLEPPYYGNELKWKLSCINRILKKYGKTPNLVECLTKCANIPWKYLGKFKL